MAPVGGQFNTNGHLAATIFFAKRLNKLMTFHEMVNKILSEAPAPPLGGGMGMGAAPGGAGPMGAPPPMGGGGMPPPPMGGGGLPPGPPPGPGGMPGDGTQPQPNTPPPQVEADNVWDALEDFLKGKEESDDTDKEAEGEEEQQQQPQQPPQQTPPQADPNVQGGNASNPIQ